jgi:predicted DCC family thiol-disulfide oxidoreductase YuxK
MGENVGKTTVLIDARCVMCNGLAKFLRRRVRNGAELDVLGIQSDEGQAIIQTFSERHRSMDTLYVVRNGRTFVRSAGAIRLLLVMRWYYALLFPLAWLVPLPLRDGAYWIVSKLRHQFGRLDG